MKKTIAIDQEVPQIALALALGDGLHRLTIEEQDELVRLLTKVTDTNATIVTKGHSYWGYLNEVHTATNPKNTLPEVWMTIRLGDSNWNG